MQRRRLLGDKSATPRVPILDHVGKDRRSRTGTFLGIPYDWRRPTRARFRERFWNPDEPRIATPRTWGWGYDVNLYRLLHPRRR